MSKNISIGIIQKAQKSTLFIQLNNDLIITQLRIFMKKTILLIGFLLTIDFLKAALPEHTLKTLLATRNITIQELMGGAAREEDIPSFFKKLLPLYTHPDKAFMIRDWETDRKSVV